MESFVIMLYAFIGAMIWYSPEITSALNKLFRDY